MPRRTVVRATKILPVLIICAKKNRTQRPLAACGPHLRDYCAHLLIPLNECRHKNYYLPWKCEHERHDYETCEYKEYTRRMHNQKVKKLMAEARE